MRSPDSAGSEQVDSPASKTRRLTVNGKVFLVGAGPGDPDLLTMKAARLLGAADAVLHNALVTQPILDLIGPKTKVIDIGKRCGHKLLTQAEINSL